MMSNDIDLPQSPPPLPPPASEALKPDAEFSESVADTPERTCPNCGAPAHGPYCYACGQSEKGMIRHLSEVMSEFADIVFNVDSRVFRSLWDLYVRPGYLTTEYLAGRRARYVTPFRLFFFLSILAFFAMQLALPDIDPKEFGVFTSISDATSPDEVRVAVDEQIEVARNTSKALKSQPGEQENFRAKEREIRERGTDRLEALKAEIDAALEATKATAKDPVSGGVKPSTLIDRGKGSPQASPDDKVVPVAGSAERGPDVDDSDLKIILFDRSWSKERPVSVEWLSDGINAKLTDTLVHMQENAESIKRDPARLLAGFISVLPQTLFLVMPLFAVLLMFFYLFKRRLYMEHLLVALHSHAFIFLSILVILGFYLFGEMAGTRIWLTRPLGWLKALAWIWLFAYLLLMQKRVYRQGWFMTTLKFCMIGISYTIVLSIAFVFALLISLALT